VILTAVMATTWTQADIQTLEAAIASGMLSVSYAGPPARSITYQSTDSMLKALALMKQSVGGGSATPYRLATTRKGFCP
jgi:hypothetical protein